MAAELVAINNQVLLYDRACRAIAEATKMDEVKEWKDRAAAYQEYARQAKNKEMEKQAKEIRLRATRRMGQLLLMLNRAPGARSDLAPSVAGGSEYKTTLAENNIPQRTAENWQALAKKSDEEFEREHVQPIYDDTPMRKPEPMPRQISFVEPWIQMIRAMRILTIEQFMAENLHGSYEKEFQKEARQLITWLKGGLK